MRSNHVYDLGNKLIFVATSLRLNLLNLILQIIYKHVALKHQCMNLIIFQLLYEGLKCRKIFVLCFMKIQRKNLWKSSSQKTNRAEKLLFVLKKSSDSVDSLSFHINNICIQSFYMTSICKGLISVSILNLTFCIPFQTPLHLDIPITILIYCIFIFHFNS